MKICYQDTDTLFIEFRPMDVAETRDLDLDKDGHICAITVEHASECADIPHVSFEQVAA